MRFFFCLLVCFPSFASAAETPNVIVILADDLGYGDLSCYGATDLKTPHIDSLATRGLKFTNFYANCPVCSPTRAALLSGRYQDMVGVPGVIRTHIENNWGYLDPEAVLLPTLLGRAGYTSGIVGKWHLGLESPNTPTERGFDFFKGFRGDMMDDYYNHRRHGINYMYENTTEIDPEGHATDLFSQWAVDFVKAQRTDQPYYLYLAYNAPHTPIQPPEEWVEKVKQREPGITDKRAKLVALIEHMDDGIGKVLAAIEETGQQDNTLILFTSDNGGQVDVGANNGPLRDGKQSMYEGGLKVPAIAVWPKKIKPGTETDLRAMTMDIYATLADLTGIPKPAECEAASFLPTLFGQTQLPLRKQMYFTRREGGLRYGGKTIDAVIEGDWKLLQNSPFEPQELYNLKNDPQEQTNLTGKAPKVYQRLAADLRKQIQKSGTVPWQRPIENP